MKKLFYIIFILLVLTSCREFDNNNITSDSLIPPQIPILNDISAPPSPHDLEEQSKRELSKNWNLVSLPIIENTEVSTFANQYPKIKSIWSWDHINNDWLVFPKTDDFELLEELEANKGYWLKTEEELELTGTGLNTNSYDFIKGWNLIGVSHKSPEISIEQFFLEGDYWKDTCNDDEPIINVWAWSNNTWLVYFPNTNGLNEFNQTHNTNFQTLENLEAGTGLWVNTTKTNKPQACPTTTTTSTSTTSSSTTSSSTTTTSTSSSTTSSSTTTTSTSSSTSTSTTSSSTSSSTTTSTSTSTTTSTTTSQITTTTLQLENNYFRFTYIAEVREIIDPHNTLNQTININDQINGHYTYDVGTEDTSNNFDLGIYNLTQTPNNISLITGGYLFFSNPENTDIQITVTNDEETTIGTLIKSNNNNSNQKEITINQITYQLIQNWDATYYYQTWLPLDPPIIEEQHTKELTITGTNQNQQEFSIKAEVTEIRLAR